MKTEDKKDLCNKIIKYLDSVIVTDDDGRQYLTVEFNEVEEKIIELFRDKS